MKALLLHRLTKKYPTWILYSHVHCLVLELTVGRLTRRVKHHVSSLLSSRVEHIRILTFGKGHGAADPAAAEVDVSMIDLTNASQSQEPDGDSGYDNAFHDFGDDGDDDLDDGDDDLDESAIDLTKDSQSQDRDW